MTGADDTAMSGQQSLTPSGKGVQLVLYVAGGTPRSMQARNQVAAIARELGAACRTEIVDVLDEPQRALAAGVFATPALTVVAGRQRLLLIGELQQPDDVLSMLQGLRSN